jgi:hypothetical protein
MWTFQQIMFEYQRVKPCFYDLPFTPILYPHDCPMKSYDLHYGTKRRPWSAEIIELLIWNKGMNLPSGKLT